MDITTRGIIALARSLEAEIILTVRNRRPFRVSVLPNDAGLEIVPTRTNRARREQLSAIGAVLDIYAKTGSLRKADYAHASFNASYIIALIKHFTDQQVPHSAISAEKLDSRFAQAVAEAAATSSTERRKRSSDFPALPEKVSVLTTAYIRNPYVAAEVLIRANGLCEMCGSPAPFNRLSDGSPYLEVHHRIRLASGGEDTVENAIAACPNCHRRAHYGAPIA